MKKTSIALRRPWIISIIALLLVAFILILGNRSFKATEEATFNEFNQRQLVMAREATGGIKLYFETLSGAMKALGSMPGIQHLDETITRRILNFEINELQRLGVNDIAVLDANGILRYNAVAHQIEGVDFSWRRYFQEAKEMTSNDTYIVQFIDFKGVEAGQKGAVVAVPMFETYASKDYPSPSGKFAGLLLCTLKLDTLTQRFVTPLKSSERGHAFLINDEYNVLWSPDGSLSRKNLLKEAAGFPSFQRIVERMAAGHSGTAEYSYYRFDESKTTYTKEKEEKLIAYLPVHLGKELWTIGVWAPKEDVRSLIRSAYVNQLLLIGLIIIVILLGSSYTIAIYFRFNKTLKREVETKTKEFKESHQRLLTVLDSLDAAVYVTDMETYNVLFVNKYLRDIFGDVVGKICWQVFQDGQTGPCDFCTNEKLLTPDGKPSDVYVWEFQNTITGNWYEIRDRAIHWVDGRIVRLEIATDITNRKRAEQQAAEQVKRLQKLSELSMTLAGDPLDVFNRIARVIGELFDVRVVCLSEIRGDELYFLSIYVDGEVMTDAGHCPLNITPCATVEESKDIRVYDHVAESFPEASFLRKYDAFSYCGFPSVDRAGNVVSVTCLLDSKPHDFSEEDKDLLRIFAQRIAMEIERQRHLTERKRAKDKLIAREHQQAVVAGLGQRALVDTDLYMLMDEAVSLVARTIGVEYCKVLELLPDGNTLLLRAGVGWKEGLVGHKTVDAGTDSQAGYTLHSSEPVIVEDLRTETRFSGPPLLIEHGVISGMSVIIAGQDRPFGILGAHTIQRRTFTKDDIHFLQAVANVLATAIGRRRAEETLLESEEKYRTLFEDSRDAIYITTRDGMFLDINQSALDLFGYSSEEMIGLDVKEIYVNPDDRQRFQREIEQEGSVRDFEVKFRKKDGTEMDCLLTSTVRQAKNGNILGYQGIIRNISDRKKLEAQLLHSQKMEAIGQLAGGIAHDFNTILTVIIGYGENLKEGINRYNDLRGYVDPILASAERGANLIQNLLAFSRKQIITPKPANLNEIVKGVEKLLSRLLGEDIELRTILAEEDLTVMADTGQIEQVLMNLATNARDVMPDGGLLTIETEPVEIDSEFIRTQGYGKHGMYALISITDTGVGMDEKTKEKIFEPFFTTKEAGKGTGLGLSIVYGIVKQHNGYINVFSEPGKGTTFKIYLPVFKTEVRNRIDTA